MHSLDPLSLFFKGGRRGWEKVNFDYLLQRGGGTGESEKLKGGGSMMQRQVFLRDGADTFPN